MRKAIADRTVREVTGISTQLDPPLLLLHTVNSTDCRPGLVPKTDYAVAARTAVRASPVASRNNGNFIVSNIRTIPSPT
jgi:hypothetical protein